MVQHLMNRFCFSFIQREPINSERGTADIVNLGLVVDVAENERPNNNLSCKKKLLDRIR
jgi:hypothetical protein